MSDDAIPVFPFSAEPPFGVGDRDPTPPGFISHVEGSEQMPEYETPEAMSQSFGAPVYAPTRWPDGADGPRYAVHFPHPESGSQWRDYRSFGALPDHPGRLIVLGSYAPNVHEADGSVWIAVPELAEMNGIANDGGPMSSVIVEVGGQTVQVTIFPSVDAAVQTALSLRRGRPAHLVTPGSAPIPDHLRRRADRRRTRPARRRAGTAAEPSRG